MEKRILGIDIGGSSVKMGILDSNGGIAEFRQISTITGDAEIMADKIAEAASEYAADIIGVGTAGRVNHKSNLVSAGNLHWKNVPLKALLEKRLQKPVWVDNDAKAAMMAEFYSGVCKGTRCAVFITLGTGLGGGLIINGIPWRGDDNTAFELGHIITHGEACDLSGETKLGRFEHYVSTSGLVRLAGGQSAREVINGVLARDPQAMDIFDMFIHELVIGLLTVIQLFRPEVIALGGGLSKAGDYLVEGVRKKLKNSFVSGSDTQIHIAAHHNNAGMIGAAALAKLYFSEVHTNENLAR